MRIQDDFDRLAREEEATSGSPLDAVLRPLRSVVSFLHTGAHPDDEMSGLLALLARRHGIRIAYACATRGEGGQNTLGRERGADLGMIRTAEMERAATSLGCHLYWLNDGDGDTIVDFRFSKSGEETLAVWGELHTLARLVAVIRVEQPDIVCPTFLDVEGQHGHHRAMTRLARQAFELAGDPAAFPDQLRDGLTPWAASKFYLPAWSGAGDAYDDTTPPPAATAHLDIGDLDHTCGVPYARIGEWSRRFHRTQGMGRWIEARPTPRPLHLAASRLPTVPQHEASVLDGLAVTLADWAKREPQLGDGLRSADAAITDALAARGDVGELQQRLQAARHAVQQITAPALPTSPALAAKLLRKVAEIDWSLMVAAGNRYRPAPSLLSDGRRANRDILPARSVTIAPTTIVVNRQGASTAFEVTVDAMASADDSNVALKPPTGVAVVPAGPRRVRAGERLQCRLTVAVDASKAAPRSHIVVLRDGLLATTIVRASYPHIGTVQRVTPAGLTLQVVNAAIAPGTRVAYVGGGADRAGHWLAGLGIAVEPSCRRASPPPTWRSIRPCCSAFTPSAFAPTRARLCRACRRSCARAVTS